jgi:hypothetical protein
LCSATGYLFSSFPSESCTNVFFGEEWFLSLFHLPIIPFGAISVPVLLVCISQTGLQPAFGSPGTQLFLSATWHGEALYGLGDQGVGVLFILGGFFWPSVASVSRQDF